MQFFLCLSLVKGRDEKIKLDPGFLAGRFSCMVKNPYAILFVENKKY